MIEGELMEKLIVTGGAGFIGSNFIKYMFDKYKYYKIINLDLLTYAGNLENLKDVQGNPNYEFIRGDIADRELVDKVFSKGVDYIINFAAESHVDRSIDNPMGFVRTNIMGTQTLLDAARKYGVKKYVQISTDEVYGSLGKKGLFTEKTLLSPNSPYSASKAAADLLVKAYYKTYKLPISITRCSNNYGPNQFPEKLIPMIIKNSLENRELPIYGDGLQIRDWLHVVDHCRAIDLVFHKGIYGEIYNIGGNNEKTNIDIVKLILELLNKPKTLIKYVKDRPGHDRRYAIDSSKIQEQLGWKPKYSFRKGLDETIRWYLENKKWWESINEK
jgi:dTDP-glucose 4,6-dehydratase